MSKRLMVFKAANVMPQVTCNYAIWIPSIWRSPVAIEQTTLPFKKTISAGVAIQGIQYQIPVKQTSQGTWSCTMSENLFMGSLYQGLNQYYKSVGGNSKMIYTFSLEDIYIFITDALTGTAPVAACVLKGCYLTDIKEISLKADGATDIMKITLSFQYNDIIDPMESVNTIVGAKGGGVVDGGMDSVAAIEAGVAGVTALAWGTTTGARYGVDMIKNLLK